MSAAHRNDQHLTDEQVSDHLAGASLDTRAETHLAACTVCQAEVDALGGMLGEFKAFSTRWAEQEAPRRIHTPSRWVLRFGPRPAWKIGLATATTAAVLALGLHMPAHVAGPSPEAANAQSHGGAPTGEELADDNRLLASIHEELNSSTQPMIPLEELRSGQHREASAAREAVAN